MAYQTEREDVEAEGRAVSALNENSFVSERFLLVR